MHVSDERGSGKPDQIPPVELPDGVEIVPPKKPIGTADSGGTPPPPPPPPPPGPKPGF